MDRNHIELMLDIEKDIEYQLAAHKRDQRLANIALGLLIVTVTVLCVVYVVAA